MNDILIMDGELMKGDKGVIFIEDSIVEVAGLGMVMKLGDGVDFEMGFKEKGVSNNVVEYF